MNLPAPDRRREAVSVIALTLLGAVLRLWDFPRLGLCHFDEGIYALSGLWALAPSGLWALDPMVIPYAPPGLPILIGLSYALLGAGDRAAILPALLCGIAAIPAAAWIARRTFGPGAGSAAAALAAMSGPHVASSRMAMADAPFLLAWLIALGLGGRFLERPGFGRAVAFGLAVGLAQNFKYNGWLAGVLVALAALAGLLLGRDGRRATVRALAFGWVAAGVVALVYWPWFRFVEEHGGYAALMRHHRGYMRGVTTWLPTWAVQMDQGVALAGVLWKGLTWGVVAWVLAWLGCGLVRNGMRLISDRGAGEGPKFRIGLLAGAVALGALPNLLWWASLAWAPRRLADRAPGMRLVATWWVVMSALTPLYHPYARLWLPVHAAGWIAAAGLVARLGPFGPDAPPSGRRARAIRIGVAIACLTLALWQRGAVTPDRSGVLSGPRPLPGLLAPTDSLRQAVAALAATAPGAPSGLRVLVRPPVLFYLAQDGVSSRRVAGLDDLLATAVPGDLALVDRVLLGQEPSRPYSPEYRLGRRFEVVGTSIYPYRLSPATLLDVDPATASGTEGHSLGWTDLLLLRAR